MTAAEDYLTKAQAALEAFITREPFGGREFDHGMLNIPLAKRGNIDADLRKWRRLNDRVAYWEGKVRAEKRRAEKPARDAAKAAAAEQYDTLDLRARYGDCTEVLWTLSGNWLRVLRWNKKSVSVDMAGTRDTIPHDQIGAAR